MNQEREQYTMGYGSSATAIMGQRTADSHAAFFLPYLKPRMRLLDCGCGPGTITLGLAAAVAPGEAIGTEIEATQVAIAQENAARHDVTNVSFKVGSIYDLPFADSSFDAAFISAILGNLQDVPKGIRELHRVLKPGGVIGVKEFDHGGDIAYPMDAGMQKYIELYLRLRRENGHDGEAGRKIGVYLHEAGFRDLKVSARYENVSGPEVLSGAAQLNVGLLKDGWASEFTRRGWATTADIDEMGQSWLNFSRTPGALLAVTWCEAIGFKPEC
jgi:ubiquinone/menaquinone biosynthesis C-methylase UbiE